MKLFKMTICGLMALFLISFAACSGDNKNGPIVIDDPPVKAIPSGLVPTLISINSVKTDEVATDGNWLVWTGLDRQGIYVSDGSETRDVTATLPVEYYPGAFVFDGRYIAFISSSNRQLFIVDSQAADSEPVLLASSTDRIESFAIDEGELVWIDNEDDIIYYADMNSASHTPVPITDGTNTKRDIKLDEGLIVWSESSDRWRVFYYDLRAASPTAIEPSGQTHYDHWMANVHDRLIVWQGSDAGNDVEIFYCDLRVNPLAAMQLTNNATDDRHPQVHNKIIAWDGSAQDTIFYIDLNAASPSINQLPTALDYDRLSKVRDGVIVWTAYSGYDAQIFYYNLNAAVPSTVQLTNQPFNNFEPSINGGRITWRTEEGSSSKILAHDLASLSTEEVADLQYSEIQGVSSGNEQYVWLSRGANRRIFAQLADSDLLNPVAVTPPDMDVSGIDIDNGIVVFRSFDGSFFQIYSGDLNDAEYRFTKLSGDYPNTGSPKINGVIVAWNGQDAGNVDQIFYTDLSAGAPAGVPIAIPGDFNHQQQVGEGIITWLGGINPNNEIYMYDTNADTPEAVNLTNNSAWESDPQIDNGVIAFNRESSGNNTDVWYIDLFSVPPLEVRVTNSTTSDDRIRAINGGVIAWTSSAGGVHDIFFYDLNAIDPVPVQVSTDGLWKSSLSLDAGKIVWYVSGEIYCYDIGASIPTPVRLTDNTVNDFGPKNKSEFIIWEGSDNSSESNATYAARW